MIGTTLIAQSWPYVFDAILSQNKTYSQHWMKAVTKYYIIQEKYFYIVYVHMNAAYSVGISILIAIGAILLSFIKHICGLFQVTRQKSIAFQIMLEIYLIRDPLLQLYFSRDTLLQLSS